MSDPMSWNIAIDLGTMPNSVFCHVVLFLILSLFRRMARILVVASMMMPMMMVVVVVMLSSIPVLSFSMTMPVYSLVQYTLPVHIALPPSSDRFEPIIVVPVTIALTPHRAQA